MRYSLLFGKTKLSAPVDADSVNARLLSQAGFIDKLAAGIYTFLPLGLRVLHKINAIIREEMNAIGGQEIGMPALHPREIWRATGRDASLDPILYRTRGAGEHDFVFGPSHEEVVTPLAAKYIQSYKDLPLALYQIQTKFRNEPRAKSGILRGREFGMKDMYSFHATEEDLDAFYEKSIQAYFKVFRRLGLDTYIMEASGGAFSDKFSHEFAVRTPAGEDTMMLCESCNFAQNLEIAGGKEKPISCKKCGGRLKEERAIEAGNIFKLGTKFSEACNLKYTDQKGRQKYITMGCYGIGNTRLVGTIVEASHDETGIIWPAEVTPYSVHLTTLGSESEVKKKAESMYHTLQEKGIDVLYDDRDESAGKKLKDADLIGIPLRLVVSRKTIEKDGIEVKKRTEKAVRVVTETKVFDFLQCIT